MSFTDSQVNDLHKGEWLPLSNQQVELFWSEGQGANIHGSTGVDEAGLLKQECTESERTATGRADHIIPDENRCGILICS